MLNKNTIQTGLGRFFRWAFLKKPKLAKIGGEGDSCITQLKAQGPSRTCNESKEEEEGGGGGMHLSTWPRRTPPLRVPAWVPGVGFGV